MNQSFDKDIDLVGQIESANILNLDCDSRSAQTGTHAVKPFFFTRRDSWTDYTTYAGPK